MCDCSPRDGPELLASAVTSKNEMAMRAGERHPIYLTVMAFVTFLLLSTTQSQTGNNLKLASTRVLGGPSETRTPDPLKASVSVQSRFMMLSTHGE